MAKNHSKINDDDNMVPPGEDQFMLGWGDAERLEKLKPGMARVFGSFSVATRVFHPEYIKGFNAYAEKYSVIPEPLISLNEEDLSREFVKLIGAELDKKKKK